MSEKPRNRPWMPALTAVVVFLAASTVAVKEFPHKKPAQTPDTDPADNTEADTRDIDSSVQDPLQPSILLSKILATGAQPKDPEALAVERLLLNYRDTYLYILSGEEETMAFRMCDPDLENHSAVFLRSMDPEDTQAPPFSGFQVSDKSDKEKESPRITINISHPDEYEVFVSIEENPDGECPDFYTPYDVDITNIGRTEDPDLHTTICAYDLEEAAWNLGISQIITDIDSLCHDLVLASI